MVSRPVAGTLLSETGPLRWLPLPCSDSCTRWGHTAAPPHSPRLAQPGLMTELFREGMEGRKERGACLVEWCRQDSWRVLGSVSSLEVLPAKGGDSWGHSLCLPTPGVARVMPPRGVRECE